MSFMNLQKNREGNLMASFKMSSFDLSHRINLFYFDERSECRNKFLSTNLMKNIENMAQIVETIKLADEETEWNKAVVFLVAMFFKYKKHNRYADKFEDTYPDAK